MDIPFIEQAKIQAQVLVPLLKVDESGLLLGVRALAHLTVDYMEAKQTRLRR
jgi:hypothetical protein